MFDDYRPCPDCGVAVGELHSPGCDVERCPACGGQMLSCFCQEEDTPGKRMPWTGIWPGVKECREFGFYARMIPGKLGWHCCSKDTEGATEDLNRLFRECDWDPKEQRWQRRENKS